MSSTSRVKLEQWLTNCLGFDDGVSDVLDYLLEIESSEDLSDYLAQLLGIDDNEILKFVDDLGRFQRGEELIHLAFESTNNIDDEKKSNTNKKKDEDKKNTVTTTTSTMNESISGNKNNKAKKEITTKQQSKLSVNTVAFIPKKAPAATTMGKGNKKQASNTASISSEYAKLEPIEKEKSLAKEINGKGMVTFNNNEKVEDGKKKAASPPLRGTPKLVCGCFGTRHKALTNCLYCGRISCAYEGYDFCAFCGNLIENITVPENVRNTKAWQHKERLLSYDKENTKRTVVVDDQSDYFTKVGGTWMSEEEQLVAEQREKDTMKNLRQRQKQQLSIAI